MNMNICGEVVRRLRLERGWTQEHLAMLADRSVKTIQRVEKTGVCDLETRSALAAVLEIELTQLDGKEKIEQAKSTLDDEPAFLHRLYTGKQIIEVFQGAYWYRFGNEEPKNAEDAETISAVVQTIQDWSEIWDDIEAGSQIKAAYSLGELLEELEAAGMWLFGLRAVAKFKFPCRDGTSTEVEGSTCNIHIAYAESEEIIRLNFNAA